MPTEAVEMASFRDRALLALSDPTQLGAALLPDGDTFGARVRTALGAVYDLTAARVDQIRSVAVQEVLVERPLLPVSHQVGAWTQTVPSFTRTEFTLDRPAPASPVWIDLLAQVAVTVVTEIAPGGAESVLSRSFDDFTTLDEFRRRFQFIDLDGFMARHHLQTVDDLRNAFDYLVTEVRLRVPPPFNANDPANVHTLTVRLAVAVVDPFDVADGLRAARLIRDTARDLTAPAPAGIPADSIAAYATAVVFADPADASLVTAVEQLYAREGVVTLFQNPG
ncbi:hypothetical protein [Dactylosporangium sp. CA-092794]|uniref:hypothetical protein n=1 Tax=Dactylosporangium sp. CA-092794 TaxID=3239929 RepID=UPI003D94E1B7